MRINGQSFEITSKHLVLHLNTPYFSAWKRFGWQIDTPGYSVNEEAINKCIELKKKILVINKYGSFEITPLKALKVGGRLSTINGVDLICIPKSAFTRLQDSIDEEKIDTTKALGGLVGTPQWEDLRKKLHS